MRKEQLKSLLIIERFLDLKFQRKGNRKIASTKTCQQIFSSCISFNLFPISFQNPISYSIDLEKYLVSQKNRSSINKKPIKYNKIPRNKAINSSSICQRISLLLANYSNSFFIASTIKRKFMCVIFCCRLFLLLRVLLISSQFYVGIINTPNKKMK